MALQSKSCRSVYLNICEPQMIFIGFLIEFASLHLETFAYFYRSYVLFVHNKVLTYTRAQLPKTWCDLIHALRCRATRLKETRDRNDWEAPKSTRCFLSAFLWLFNCTDYTCSEFDMII